MECSAEEQGQPLSLFRGQSSGTYEHLGERFLDFVNTEHLLEHDLVPMPRWEHKAESQTQFFNSLPSSTLKVTFALWREGWRPGGCLISSGCWREAMSELGARPRTSQLQVSPPISELLPPGNLDTESHNHLGGKGPRDVSEMGVAQ